MHSESADVVAKGNFSTGFAGCESSGRRRIFGIAVDESGKSTYTGSFLTARDLEEDALLGYELGAVDYVTKPFSTKILLKKIAVILRNGDKPENFSDGHLWVSLSQGKVMVKQRLCAVTPTEFRILSAFIRANEQQLLTYDMLLDTLWDCGNQIVDRHALAVNIGRLRNKIEDDTHKYIVNVYGMGYQWIGNGS